MLASLKESTRTTPFFRREGKRLRKIEGSEHSYLCKNCSNKVNKEKDFDLPTAPAGKDDRPQDELDRK